MDIILYIVDEGSACCNKTEKVEKKQQLEQLQGKHTRTEKNKLHTSFFKFKMFF